MTKFASWITALIVWGTLIGYVSASTPMQMRDTEFELARAEEKAGSAEKRYARIKQLHRLGSASSRELRRAELERDLAAVDLSSLREPVGQEKNQRLKAKLILRYRDQELDLVRELFRHGSATELNYFRAVASRDIAQSQLDAIESETETQRKFHLIQIAKSKYVLAKKEHDIAQRLLASGSISQPLLDQSTASLRLAVAELESCKKSLGARAIRVRQ